MDIADTIAKIILMTIGTVSLLLNVYLIRKRDLPIEVLLDEIEDKLDQNFDRFKDHVKSQEILDKVQEIKNKIKE